MKGAAHTHIGAARNPGRFKETVNGLYKAELIHAKRVWESTEAVELATMGWVHWWNTTRLHEALGYHTPAEVEAAYTHDQDSAPGAS